MDNSQLINQIRFYENYNRRSTASASDREAFGARDFMVIRFTPIGAQMLLGAPMDLLTDRTLALEDVDGRFARLLMAHAETTRDWAARFDIVENIIAARLASAWPVRSRENRLSTSSSASVPSESWSIGAPRSICAPIGVKRITIKSRPPKASRI